MQHAHKGESTGNFLCWNLNDFSKFLMKVQIILRVINLSSIKLNVCQLSVPIKWIYKFIVLLTDRISFLALSVHHVRNICNIVMSIQCSRLVSWSSPNYRSSSNFTNTLKKNILWHSILIVQ